MKPQNFFDFLEYYGIDTENILSYCEEKVEFDEDFADLLRKDINNPDKDFICAMELREYDAKDEKELISKKKEDLRIRKENIANSKKFIKFLKKEMAAYYKITNSDEFTKYLDNADDEEDFFEPIDLITAYIDKHSGVKVADLCQTFNFIMENIADEIQDITGSKFPIKDDLQATNLIRTERVLDADEANELVHYTCTYEDFGYLVDMIKTEINELNEPVKI